MADLILIGAGGHARSCIDVVEMQGIWHIHGILDIPEKVGALVMGYPVIGTDADIERYASKGFTFLNCLGQVGASPVRMRVAEMLQSLRAEEAVVVSPLAHVAKSASI